MLSHLVDALATLPAPLVLVAVGTFALLESAVLAGLVLPGEAVVVLGASLAPHSGRFVLLVWLIAAAGSVTGDIIGYNLGRRLGPNLRAGWLGRRVGDRRWQAAEAALTRTGGRGVIAGKFVGVVRPLVPPLAGIVALRFRRFLLASTVASTAWTAMLVAIGAAAGTSASRWLDQLGRAGWCVLALGIPIGFVLVIRRRRRASRREPAPAPELAVSR